MAHSWLQTFAKRANFHQRFSATASCSTVSGPSRPLARSRSLSPTVILFLHSPYFTGTAVFDVEPLVVFAPSPSESDQHRRFPCRVFFFSPWYYVLFDWCNATTIQVGFQALPGCWAVVTQLGCHKNVHCITHQSSDACNSSQTVTASHKDFPELHPNNPYSFENALLCGN
jgi:hypothetical protein